MTPPFEALYRTYHTPENIVAHMQLVAKIAVIIAHARQSVGDTINVGLVEAAAKLHDLVRLKEQWVYLPSTISTPLPHAEINYLLLKDHYPEVAATIRPHSLMTILTPQPFANLEQKVVYYADKRVNHATIVSLSERLHLGRTRWGVNATNDHSLELMTKLSALEQELFSQLTIEPDQIHAFISHSSS